MLQLLNRNNELNYSLYRSQIVVDRNEDVIRDVERAVSIFRKEFPEKDSTWTYKFYNTFAVTAPSPLFYELFTDLKTVIREYAGHDRPLWMQSWINYHHPHQLLDWHDHHWPFHGYISIDPKKSNTVFDEYTIENAVGNIYIGPGYRRHKVEATERFFTPRITLGFDVLDESEPDIVGQFSLIPI
jgi:hypothetical protein